MIKTMTIIARQTSPLARSLHRAYKIPSPFCFCNFPSSPPPSTIPITPRTNLPNPPNYQTSTTTASHKHTHNTKNKTPSTKMRHEFEDPVNYWGGPWVCHGALHGCHNRHSAWERACQRCGHVRGPCCPDFRYINDPSEQGPLAVKQDEHSEIDEQEKPEHKPTPLKIPHESEMVTAGNVPASVCDDDKSLPMILITEADGQGLEERYCDSKR